MTENLKVSHTSLGKSSYSSSFSAKANPKQKNGRKHPSSMFWARIKSPSQLPYLLLKSIQFLAFLIIFPFTYTFNKLAKVISIMRRKDEIKQTKLRPYFINSWYAFSGNLYNHSHPKHGDHFSLFKLKPSIKHKLLFILGLICLLQFAYNFILYSGIYMQKYFFDSFQAANTPMVYHYFKLLAVITIVNIAVRTAIKFLRKRLQSNWKTAIQVQWIKKISMAGDIQNLERKYKEGIGQKIEQEVDDYISYATITVIQTQYMLLDFSFYFYFLYVNTPGLLYFAFAILLSAHIILEIPKRFQFHFQTKDRELRTTFRDRINNFIKRIPLINAIHSHKDERDNLIKHANAQNDNYTSKLSWEAIFSSIKRTFIYFATPICFFILYPSYTTGAITFGATMIGIRCLKEFLRTIMLINSNFKMFNKQNNNTDRIFATLNRINETYEKVAKRAKEIYTQSTDSNIHLPEHQGDQPIFKFQQEKQPLYFHCALDEIKPGAYMLVGQSGSGKSVFISAVSGALHKNDSLKDIPSKIKLPKHLHDSTNINFSAIYTINKNSTSQSLEGQDKMSVADFLKYPKSSMACITDETRNLILAKLGATVPSTYQEEPKLTTLSGVENISSYWVSNLSSGQKQLLDVARLLMLLEHHKNNPENFPYRMIVLDEADSNIDADAKQSLYELLLQYIKFYQNKNIEIFWFLVSHCKDTQDKLLNHQRKEEQPTELSELAKEYLQPLSVQKNGNKSRVLNTYTRFGPSGDYEFQQMDEEPVTIDLTNEI